MHHLGSRRNRVKATQALESFIHGRRSVLLTGRTADREWQPKPIKAGRWGGADGRHAGNLRAGTAGGLRALDEEDEEQLLVWPCANAFRAMREVHYQVVLGAGGRRGWL